MQLINIDNHMADGHDCFLDADLYTYQASAEFVRLNEYGNYQLSPVARQFLESKHLCLAGTWVHPQADGSFHITAMEA
jgi:hypothetical protein